jgi:hypothetical protein
MGQRLLAAVETGVYDLEEILYVTMGWLDQSTDPCTVPDEGFIGAEPKLKPTTWETAPANFSLMSSEKLQRAFKCYPSYERLSKEDDSQYPSQAHLIESKACIFSSSIFSSI